MSCFDGVNFHVSMLSVIYGWQGLSVASVVMVVSNSSYEMWYASEYPLLKDMSRESAIVLPSFLWASSGHMLAPVRIKDWIR